MPTISRSIQFRDSREGGVTFPCRQGAPPPSRLSSPSLPVRREQSGHRVQCFWLEKCTSLESDEVSSLNHAARDAVSPRRRSPRRPNKPPDSARQSHSVGVYAPGSKRYVAAVRNKRLGRWA